MFKILKKTQFSEKVFEFRVHAPRMAKHAHAGQFLMVRINETGERVPFTFANWNLEEGWIEFIFMVVGKTTQCLSELNEGDEIQDITGPLGCPTEIEGDRVAVVGGGVGLAIAYPVARTLCEQGKKVSVIMGARNKDLLILFEQFASLPLENLFITTDDGSMGEKGVVTLPLRRLCETDSIDSCFCVGPDPHLPRVQDSHRRELEPDHGRRHRHVRMLPRRGGRRNQVRLRRRPGFRCEPRRLGRPRSSPGELQGRGSRFHQAS